MKRKIGVNQINLLVRCSFECAEELHWRLDGRKKFGQVELS